jgi:hypothetical protein
MLTAGAVALASGAYAIGTQVGGGSAVAEDSADGGPPSFLAEPLNDLADRLGVDRDELREALEDYRRQHKPRLADEFAGDLADALGKPREEVERALEELREDAPPPGRLERHCGPGLLGTDLRDLARALDVTPAELRRALSEIRPDREIKRAGGPDELAEFLAERFDLSADRAEEALEDALPAPPELHFRGSPGPGFGPPGDPM